MLDAPVDRRLVTDLAGKMVAAAAPEELPAFGAVSRAYRAGQYAAGRGGSADSPLGFGPGEVVLLVTPVALAAASRALQDVIDAAVGPAADRGAAAFSRAARRLLCGASGPAARSGEAALVLTAEQRQRVRRIVEDTAVRAGVDHARARLMADAVAGQVQPSGDQP